MLKPAVARPPVYKTKELVHNALFIGNQLFHINATITEKQAMVKSHATFSASVLSVCFKVAPTIIPYKQVATAGNVLNTPSGSHVFVPLHMWLGVRTILSNHAARFLPGSRMA